MKTKKHTILVIVLALVSISLIAITATSQLQSSSVSFEEKQNCNTFYYTEKEDTYTDVTRERKTFGNCFNENNNSNYICETGTETYLSHERTGQTDVQKSREECKPNKIVITTNKLLSTEKKEIDFSSYGVCVQENENGCIAVICGTLKGGSARNGIFNGCDGGKQCQKFLFCEDGDRVLFKGSLGSFVEDDPTFRLPKLQLKKVEE